MFKYVVISVALVTFGIVGLLNVTEPPAFAQQSIPTGTREDRVGDRAVGGPSLSGKPPWTHRPTLWCHTRRLAGLVTYHPGRPSVDRSDSPRSRPVPDAAASVCWVSRAKGSGVTAMESTC